MLIGLVGFIGSGKNTAAEYLVQQHNFHIDSFAKTLKDVVAIIFGWDRGLLEGNTIEGREFRDKVDEFWAANLNIPEFTPRYALQRIGTDVMREHFNNNIWILTLLRRLTSTENVVVSDARFINEINTIKQAGGVIIRIKRGPEPVWFEVAKQANQGCVASLERMKTEFHAIHESEWGWIGCDIDITINNDGTIDKLFSKLDGLLQK